MGAVDYVTKPFNPPELLARVGTHLELKCARQRLREMNDEKNEFMGIAAHDLRSPLNAVKGYTEMLLEEEAMDRPEQDDLLGRIHDATRRLVEMVQNLLDVNAIERGEMNLQLAPVDLSSLLASAVERHRPRAAAKQQSLHLEDEAGPERRPVTVRIDPNLTVQVLENLISNAVKYSPPGKNIFLRLKRSPDTIRCEVQDEGPGLSAEDQKKLFGKFARLSAKPTGGEHSTGLGLSIVKKMVILISGRRGKLSAKLCCCVNSR